ncbi:Hypothetical protein, putative [Bodo saltans]|uniref:Uncharacterized protein n=1 Tax=Bodo saltans TaxID=75058 RepID=A0A0S4JB02_BODSA|nr:Hypothetical protein, putative [Bodo saltans]|eukprot:CUG86603.1 Hypothetical protein, putative [Bodo saltans]
MRTMRIRKWWLETLPSLSVEIPGADLKEALDILEWCCIEKLVLEDATDEHLAILTDKYLEEEALNAALISKMHLSEGSSMRCEVSVSDI